MTDIDVGDFEDRLPDGWVLDGADEHDVMADNRDEEMKLLRRVMVEVEYPDHSHFNERYYAEYWGDHPLPNIHPDSVIEEFDTLDEAVDQAIEWAESPPG